MAKAALAEKRLKSAWIKFTRDPKDGSFILSRYDEGEDEMRIQFPRPQMDTSSEPEARLLYGGDGDMSEDAGQFLQYRDVQWLAQAMTELLNEMERAGCE